MERALRTAGTTPVICHCKPRASPPRPNPN